MKFEDSDLLEESKKSAAWNMAQHLINILGDLLSTASESFIRDDFRTAFLSLKECKNKIFAYLNELERKEFADKEKIILKELSWLSNEDLLLDNPKLYGKVRYFAAKRVDEYQQLVMIKLTKYGFGVSVKTDTTILKG